MSDSGTAQLLWKWQRLKRDFYSFAFWIGKAEDPLPSPTLYPPLTLQIIVIFSEKYGNYSNVYSLHSAVNLKFRTIAVLYQGWDDLVIFWVA